MMPAPKLSSNIALSLWQCGPECRENSNHLLVTEPLDSAKGGTTPDSCSLCVNSGDVAALGRPLHKALRPEAALVDLQKKDIQRWCHCPEAILVELSYFGEI